MSARASVQQVAAVDDTGPTPARPSVRCDLGGGDFVRSKSHETLVNSCAEWLAAHGYKPGCNSAVDLGLELPPVVFEAKVIGPSWASSIRAAVGQLYEYRYFQVTDPRSGLIFLTDQAVPDHWITYLERETEASERCGWPDRTSS